VGAAEESLQTAAAPAASICQNADRENLQRGAAHEAKMKAGSFADLVKIAAKLGVTGSFVGIRQYQSVCDTFV
jgi:hypothetical protein